MQKIIKWGIIGCGKIAPKFIQAIEFLPNTQVVAVASKSMDRARALAQEHGIENYFDSYEALVSMPQVDVVYVATSHNFHYQNVMLCLRHRKAVLCEKAFMVNAREAQEVIDFARHQGVFLMEAMWTRFLPSTLLLKKMIREDVIGQVRHLQADFGGYAPYDPHGRMYNRELAGGALLDLGIYPISLAFHVFGKAPSAIKSSAIIGLSGVDNQNAMIFSYDDGEMAILSSSLAVQTAQNAVITGTKGSITIARFHRGESLILKLNGQEPKEFMTPYLSTGYNYEAQAVIEALREGWLESAVMPLDESLAIMQCMDSMRMDWGMHYPADLL